MKNFIKNWQTVVAYKLVRIKGGKLYPLFINRNEEIKMYQWLPAQCHPTKGFAVRHGWHCTQIPVAPHLKLKLKSGEQRVWVMVIVENFAMYQRPESQGGTWILAQKMMVLEVLKESDIREET